MIQPEEYENNLFSPDDAEDVEDETEGDKTVAPVRYEITSFGIDFDVEGVFRRVKRGEIFMPEFQRNYIWRLPEASRFIESLLLGLPVPGIFLAQEPDSGKLLVIDGQQRLKSILFFYNGVFNPLLDEKTQRVFRLLGVQEEFEGLAYEDLDERDRINLDNSVIHATVVRQDTPLDNDSSTFHIFERLNSGGRRLYPQEMRCAIYHGDLINKIKSLNEYDNWRNVFGKVNPRLKDQELILRFFALYFNENGYKRPMLEFLNAFANKHRKTSATFLKHASDIFTSTIDAFESALGRSAFRLQTGRAFNAAVFDSMAVGLARRIDGSDTPKPRKIKEAYGSLLSNEDYLAAVSQSTSNEPAVFLRLDKAKTLYAEL